MSASEQASNRAAGEEAAGSLLVHIPFHFDERRWGYLREVLGALARYQLARVCVVVDTNSDSTRELVAGITTDDRFTVRVDVHRNLSHPFDLTWTGRADLAARSSDFDYFMYIEDDILVPWDAFDAWRAEEPELDRRGLMRGFLRVETDERGRAVATDWFSTVTRPVAFAIGGRRYVRPESFYHACWICGRGRMRWFVASEAWSRGFHRWSSVVRAHRRLRGVNYTREYSAFGWACAAAGAPRVVLPIDAEGRIARTAWIRHLPNNYALDSRQRGGRIAADELLVGPMVPAESACGRARVLGAHVAETMAWAAYLARLDLAWAGVDRAVRALGRKLRALAGWSRRGARTGACGPEDRGAL